MTQPRAVLLRALVTERCNLRCAYCYARKQDRDLGEETRLHILALARRLADEGRRLEVELTGGEPFVAFPSFAPLAEGLHEIISRSPAGGRIMAITNATLLTDAHLAFCAQRRVALRVSLDGDPAVCLRHRRPLPGDEASASARWQAAFDAVGAARTHGVDLTVNMVVAPATVDLLLDSYFTLYDLARDYVKISPVIGVFWPEEALARLDERLGRLNRLLLRHAGAFATAAFLDDLDHDLRHAAYVRGEGFGATPKSLSVTIDPEGVCYRDEFDPRTRPMLVAGRLGPDTRLDQLRLTGPDSMALTYAQNDLDPEVLTRQRQAYRILGRRLAELREGLAPRVALLPPEETASACGVDVARALALIAPLRPGAQRLGGFLLRELRPDGAGQALLCFENARGLRVEVALLPKELSPDPYLATRRYALLLKADHGLTDTGAEVDALVRAVGKLVGRHETDSSG